MGALKKTPAADRRLILASASPRRREFFRALGLSFRTAAVEVDERPPAGEAPEDLVRRLSLAKARAAALTCREPALVVGADTVVVFGGRVLGKPADAADARCMLRAMRGRMHRVCSAVSFVDTVAGCAAAWLAETQVRMRPYSNQEIEDYLATGDPFDKAGGYAIQHPGFRPVESVVGCYANVMGLPLCLLAHGLEQFDFPLEADVSAACRAFTGWPCRLVDEVPRACRPSAGAAAAPLRGSAGGALPPGEDREFTAREGGTTDERM